MQYSHAQASERMQFLDRALPQFERRHGLAISIALVAVDVILLWFAFWSAYELRYGFEIGGNIFPWDLQSFSAFYGRAAMFVLFCLASFAVRGVYRLPKWTSQLDEATMITGAVTVAMGAVILTNYLSRFSPSRLVFVYAWVLSIGYLLLFRAIRRGMRQALWRRSIGIERVLVVGSGDIGRRIAQAVIAAPDAGLRIAGYVDEPGMSRSMQVASEQGIVAAQRLGSLDDIPTILDRHRIDQVIIAVGGDHHDRMIKVGELCSAAAKPFHIVPDLLQLSFDRAELSELAGVPLLGVRNASIVGGNAAVKRVIDIVIAIPLLVLCLAPFGIAMTIRKRGGVSPLILKSECVGRNGELFSQFRLSSIEEDRAMDVESSKLKSEAGLELDPMHRQSCAWLVIGGIPLLLNVLRGEMSLVGPLAQRRQQVQRYDDWHRARLRVTPGITGLWAVQGRRDLTFDEMVRLDLFYAEHWSLWLDLKVLIRSVSLLRKQFDGG
jgi:lipopolysaccharide/colanic/teichoic acid biosynthesis glycosyltransferase